jgi:hypothetical protein
MYIRMHRDKLGSVDVVLQTTDGVIRLGLYCRVEVQQVMQVVD